MTEVSLIARPLVYLLKSTFRIVALPVLASAIFQQACASDLLLWYKQPAVNAMNEALPIGNAHMGGLVFGAPEKERICLNEISLWTGNDNPSGNYDSMGAYQFLGNLYIQLPGHEKATNYRRDLDIGDAQAHVMYDLGGAQFRREYFCSNPAGVFAMRFTSTLPAGYTGSIELNDSHQANVKADGNRLEISGALSNGLKYSYQMVALNEGGSLSIHGSTVEFRGCKSLTLLLAAATDYAMDYRAQYRGQPPQPVVASRLDAALRKNYDTLKAEHIADFHALFNRAAIDLGKSTPTQTALPTDLRKRDAFQTVDPELEQLLFQYGRYLMISSSRPGGLPANLQGLWNDSNKPMWHCDYHSNINIQMNYWPADVANLSECHVPFFDLIKSQIPVWRSATAAAPEFKTNTGAMSSRGFAIRTSHNIFGGMGWKWDNTANAWYCQHLWEHYAYTGDKRYLQEVAYPIMKETCQFWEDHLKTLSDGRLVVPQAWSPEHGPVEDGVSYSQEIVWDLFNNSVEACDALKIDSDYRNKLAALRDKLLVPGVGSWGQLLEWMQEKKDVDPKHPVLDTPNDHHRHTSHLFGVFPGRQISLEKTPALAAAAKVSLDARGIDSKSDVREWSFAWRSALYARLHDGEKAHFMLQNLFSDRNTCANLFGLHPPMQIDGNFGVTAAMAEMLMQSHTGEISLLPALPKAWPTGSIKGLRARGGCEVDMVWKDGKLVSSTIRNAVGGSATLRYGGQSAAVRLEPGKSLVWTPGK